MKGSRVRGLADEAQMRERSPSLFQFNEKLLQDPNRLYQFRKFVEAEYADEHLQFHLDVTQWKDLKTPSAKKERAEEILNLYVRPQAEKQINIEERHLKNMCKMAEEGNYDTIFDVAMGEVFKLMKLDSYQRFSRSVFFQAMLEGNMVKEEAFGEEVFIKFMELCTGRDQPWTLIKKKNDAETYEQSVAGQSGLQLLKAVVEVAGTPHDVASVLADPALTPKWDKECVGSYELERFGERFSTIYVAYKGSMLGAAQTDFVLAQFEREFSDGTVCIIWRSIPNGEELVPEKKQFVRARMETGGWMLDPVPGASQRTRITSIQEVDYSGKANKRTMDAAKARMVSIVALRDFLNSYKPKEDRTDRRRSMNL